MRGKVDLNPSVDMERARRARSLKVWLEKSKEDFNAPHRFPQIEFEGNTWPIRSVCKTRLADVRFESIFAALKGLDDTFGQMVRCFAAEEAVADEKRDLTRLFNAWRALARVAPPCLIDLRVTHLVQLEAQILQESIEGRSAADGQSKLDQLERDVVRLVKLGVVGPLNWQVSHDCRKTLRDLEVKRRTAFRQDKACILDRQIEALSDATRAMFLRDPRLSRYDVAVLATMNVAMCAPSRVNEPMCMAVDDVFTLEDYAARPKDLEMTTDLGRAHMVLLQKGSKGASWNAKPALNFMIALLEECMKILIAGGQRSRMLASWYEEHPDQLFLPPELEHLRGKMIERETLWQIVNLTDRLPTTSERSSVNPIMNDMKAAGLVQVVRNRRVNRVTGGKNTRTTIGAVAWHHIEQALLRRVKAALESCRRVTNMNHYEGRLSKMLMLFDSDITPYLPKSLKYSTFRKRLKETSEYREYKRRRAEAKPEPTIFQKLDLTMVVDGVVQFAWIETHDPRRWLTTQALDAKERLSDVLVNKWANRLAVDQLKNYDLRSETKKADQSDLPMTSELADISAGIQKIDGLEARYGLLTEIVTVKDAGISMTSMDAIVAATGDRPVARTSNQIIILYPTRFGMCTHQHHETPCRAYECLPCNENIAVKGHNPTNEQIRTRNAQVFRSIVAQVDRLVTARNREIADLPESLDDHIITLVEKGLSSEQMADELISQFHEIKDRVKNTLFRVRLEEAFIARGIVQRLDSADVPSGAMIRYHNPSRHASPGHERALDSIGGRAELDSKIDDFQREHPEFSRTGLSLQDEREKLVQEDEGEDEHE
jgi:hypothetical protein